MGHSIENKTFDINNYLHYQGQFESEEYEEVVFKQIALSLDYMNELQELGFFNEEMVLLMLFKVDVLFNNMIEDSFEDSFE